MKALKRILVFALALVMILPLFACNGGGSGTFEAPDVTEYVFDYQVIENNTISLDVKSKPDDLVFVEDSSTEYSISYTDGEGKIDIELDKYMLGERAYKLMDDKEKAFAEIKVTVNPITSNYYNVDADKDGAGFSVATTAKATDVKVEGQEVGAGVTVGDTAIKFEKSFFADKMGKHVKLEYLADGVKYAVSVCAVNQKDLDNPITFEDGKLSPFVSVLSQFNDHKVVDVFAEKKDNGSNLVDATQMRYYISADGSEKENRYQLAVKSDSKVFISAYYLIARVEKLNQRELTDDTWENWDAYTDYNFVAKGFYGNDYGMSKFAFFETENEIQSKKNFAFYSWMNNGANYTAVLTYDMYLDLLGDNGSRYISCEVPKNAAGGLGYMYLDDIGATLDVVDSPEIWHGGNSKIHCQNPYGEGDAGRDEFRLLMDKVCLED